ncbi:hypothetical protein MTQ17_08840, partial [Corynebacterium bovis]
FAVRRPGVTLSTLWSSMRYSFGGATPLKVLGLLIHAAYPGQPAPGTPEAAAAPFAVRRPGVTLSTLWSSMRYSFGGATPLKVLGLLILAALPSLIVAVVGVVAAVAAFGAAEISADGAIDGDGVAAAVGVVLLVLVVLVVASVLSSVMSANVMARMSERTFAVRGMTWLRNGWRIIGGGILAAIFVAVVGGIAMLVLGLVAVAVPGLEADNGLLFSLLSVVIVGIPYAVAAYAVSLGAILAAHGLGPVAALGTSWRLARWHWRSYGFFFAAVAVLVALISLVSAPEISGALEIIVALTFGLALVIAQLALVGVYRGTVPLVAETPVEPGQPVGPGQPGQPVEPGQPGASVDPGQPGQPGQPGER